MIIGLSNGSVFNISNLQKYFIALLRSDKRITIIVKDADIYLDYNSKEQLENDFIKLSCALRGIMMGTVN